MLLPTRRRLGVGRRHCALAGWPVALGAQLPGLFGGDDPADHRLLDPGASPGLDVLIERLIATLIGAGLVIGTNWLFGKFAWKTS